MQEASQLVALVNQQPGQPGADGMYRHYLASQCGTQIFVNSLVYQKKWIDYLQTGQNTDAFATLQSYGPYYIDSIRDVSRFALIIVALSLYLS
ncbi:hypothetical protein CBS147323_5917 [Aspergillus niger]|nr:hypothetical protein CBS147323_5917 [Aspergillus niger]KAI3021123.1 hypothetical protein CBS147347_8030 [Aspergillus niger]KAI3064472.1 hypothetical protein CBS147353_8642 [Aspergillus niger]